MNRSALYSSVCVASILVAVSCAPTSKFGDGGFGGDGQDGVTSSGTPQSTGAFGTTASTAAGLGPTTVGSGGSTSSGVVCNSGPNDDMDHDGWTVAQGDCNDCDPNVNPGAIDLGNNEDCDASTSASAPCDSGLALDDTNPVSGAKAIELCQAGGMDGPKTAMGPKWGVLSAAYTGADGSNKGDAVQHGIMAAFGSNVHAQGGANMLVLSSGNARTPNQPDSCGDLSCTHSKGTPPSGFPQDVPNCDGKKNINDDIALDLHIRAPTNATGYKFNFKFYSFEYPVWVCTNYNDQFIALVNPAPMGSINGNVAFDKNKNPVSVNIGFFDVCNSNDKQDFAQCCVNNDQLGCDDGQSSSCPNTPSPYCPSGPGDLAGTGFDIWGNYDVFNNPTSSEAGGATSWLETSAPITGGQDFEIRFAIWDTGDQYLDSTVLVDNFQWVANGGTVTVGTNPETNPK